MGDNATGRGGTESYLVTVEEISRVLSTWEEE